MQIVKIMNITGFISLILLNESGLNDKYFGYKRRGITVSKLTVRDRPLCRDVFAATLRHLGNRWSFEVHRDATIRFYDVCYVRIYGWPTYCVLFYFLIVYYNLLPLICVTIYRYY